MSLDNNQERPTAPPSIAPSDEPEEREETGSPSGRCPHCTIHRDHDSICQHENDHVLRWFATSRQMTKGMQLGVSSHLFIFGHLPIFHFAALETLPVTQVEINLIAIDMRTIFGTREPFSSTATPETWALVQAWNIL